MDDDVYYRLYIRDDGTISVVTMQWFDEFGYNENRFVNGERYGTKEQAEYMAEYFRFHPRSYQEQRLAYLRERYEKTDQCETETQKKPH